jgi:hypothetical protein
VNGDDYDGKQIINLCEIGDDGDDEVMMMS